MLRILQALALCLILSACGGGDDKDDDINCHQKPEGCAVQ